MTELLERMSEILAENFYLGILFAFLAGVITVFTPCSLSSVPLIVSYVSGTGADKKRALLYSVFICIGQTVVFVSLGIAAALAGKLVGLGGFGRIWHIILALLMVFMAMELWGLTNFLAKSSNLITKVSKKGILGAFLVGVLGGLFCTPCTTPILVAMLAYVASTGAGIIQGAILLLSYSIGHSLLLVIGGTSIGFVNQLSNSEKFEKASKIVRMIFGTLVFALGIYFILTLFYI